MELLKEGIEKVKERYQPASKFKYVVIALLLVVVFQQFQIYTFSKKVVSLENQISTLNSETRKNFMHAAADVVLIENDVSNLKSALSILERKVFSASLNSSLNPYSAW